jgi:hypothetical protein
MSSASTATRARSRDRMLDNRRWGTIAYQGKPDVADSVPPFTLEIHGYHGCGPTRKATTLRRLTRKLDEAEGALHRTQRERSISGVTEP